MNRKAITIIIMVLVFSVVSSQAQIVSTDINLQSGSYELESDGIAENYTQKLERWNNKNTLGLTKMTEGFNRLLLIDKDNTLYLYVDIPSTYQVTDFTVLDDTVYLSGYTENSISSNAFIGYANINNLFYGNHTLRITPIDLSYVGNDTVYSIRKIKVYKNKNLETVVTGIGSMYYGKPTADVYEHVEIPLLNVDTWDWVRHSYSKYYSEFLMFYKITEDTVVTNGYDVILTGATPQYSLANEVKMFKNPHRDVDSNYTERFEDITLTDNNVCIVSSTMNFIEYDENNLPINRFIKQDYDGHDNTVIIRKINKYNYDSYNITQKSQKYQLPELYHPDYGIRLEALDGEEVALVYVLCNMGQGVTKTIIDKINTDGEDFTLRFSYLLDSVTHRTHVLRDIAYMKQKKTLLILKSEIGEHGGMGAKNNVFIVDMNDNLPTPITIQVRDISYPLYSNIDYPIWNDILLYDDYYYACFGRHGGWLTLSDIRAFGNANTCTYIGKKDIYGRRLPEIVNDVNLEQCKFEYIFHALIDLSNGQQMLTIRYMPTLKYNASINEQSIQIGKRAIMKKCETK